MHNSYQNAPVIEVVCVLGVDSLKPLTNVEVDEFRKYVSDSLPLYSETENDSIPQENKTKQYLFQNKDKNLTVTLSNKMIEYHLLGNYSSADDLYTKLGTIYEHYKKAVPVEKIQFCQIGYLNKITIPSNIVTLSDYFTFAPNYKKTLVDFIVGYEIVDSSNFRTSVSLSPTKSNTNDSSAFILDIRGITPNEGLKDDSFPDIVQRIHNNIETEFESAITDKTRDLFRRER